MSTTDKQSYQIRHSWGDPREPEYKNGYLVIRIYYKEKSIRASFKVYASNENSDGINWILEAPVDLRKNLGNLWPKRTIVFDRVISHLKEISSSDNRRIMQNKFVNVPENNLFKNIVVDTSKVKGWLKIKLEAINVKLLPVKFTLPSKNTFPPLALGLFLVYLSKTYSINLVSDKALSVSLKILAVSTIALLIRDIANDYKMLSGVFVIGALQKPGFNWRGKAVSQAIKHFGRRYVLTFGLAIFLFNM